MNVPVLKAVGQAVRGRYSLAGRLVAWLGVLVSLVMLAVIWRKVEVAELVRAISRVAPADIAMALSMLLLAYMAKILRWRVLLLPLARDPGVLVHGETFLGGIALNNVLPLRAGDIARVVAFRPQLGPEHSALVGVLVVERVLDLILLLVLIASVALRMPAGVLPAAVSGPLTVVVVLAGLSGLLAVVFSDRLAGLVGRIAGMPRLKVMRPVLNFAEATLSTMAVQARGVRLAGLVAMTALAWLLEGQLYVVTAHALQLPEAMQAGYFAFALATLSTLVPSSPGYFGTFHVFAMMAVQAFGASASDAAAFAFLTHMLHWLPVTIAGVTSLLLMSLRSSSLADAETP